MFERLLHAFDVFRRLLVNIVFLFVIVLLVVAYVMYRPSVPDGAALIIDPGGRIVEQPELASPAETALTGMALETRMRDVLDAIHMARDDARIRLMVLDLKKMERMPLPRLRALRQAILDFRSSGKKVVAVGDYYSQSQYYLAACADTVFLHPQGAVLLHGLGLYQPYFKDALDRLKADVHVFRAGRYKSVAEPFSRNTMSDAARENARALLQDLWHGYKRDVAHERGMDEGPLQDMLDHPAKYLARYGGSPARLALGMKLVDRLADRYTADRYIAAKLGKKKAGGRYASIGFRKYLLASGRDESPDSDQLVGVVVASGPILDGDQPPGLIGSDTLAGLLRKAEQDTDVRAVVLRVDSPGGSALASEVIRGAVLRLKAAGKPVVVSMGSVAASGGYWVSAPADEIWASPATITGSIGVVGLLADVHRGLSALGVHSDGVGTTTITGALRPDRPLPTALGEAIQMAVDEAYRRFLRIVSEGRKLPLKRVEKIAQGRVYSGRQAKEIGLVDKLGGLDAAVKAAAGKAGIADTFEVRYFEAGKSLPEMLLQRLVGMVQALTGVPTGWLSGVRLPWLRLNDPLGVYAYCFGVS